METIKKGSRGDAVKTLQNCLGLKADGIFGKCTEDAVKSFQEANKLVPDGIVGTKTWEKLLANTNPQKTAQTSRKIKEVILHCSATPEGKDYSVSTIRQWHRYIIIEVPLNSLKYQLTDVLPDGSAYTD